MAGPEWYTKRAPNGEWYKTQASSPEEAAAKLNRAIGAASPTPPAGPSVRPDNAIDRMFPTGDVHIEPEKHATGLQGIGDALENMRTRLSMIAQRGGQQAGGDLLLSPLTGLLEVLKGQTRLLSGHYGEAAKDYGKGALEASTIPSAFMAPEIKGALPSLEKAGRLFEEVEGMAGRVPINIRAPGQEAFNAVDLASKGGNAPKVVMDFLDRITSRGAKPLTFSEAREFYKNATRLSSEEYGNLNPVMKRALIQFTQRLGDSLWEAAQSVGKGPTYNRAMRMYSNMSGVNRYMTETLPKLGKAAAYGGAGVIGAGALAKLADMLGLIPHPGGQR